MKPLFAIFMCLVSSLVMQGQGIADYHLEAGLSVSDRYMDMTEVNSRYAFIGLGHIQDDPEFRYSYDGKIKPYNNTATFSGFVTWKPFRNKGFNLSLQYDCIPAAVRKVTITRVYDIDVTEGNSVIGVDTIKDVSYNNSFIVIQTACAVLGYDFGIKNLVCNVGIGISYNTFQIAGNSSGVTYHTYKPAPNWDLDPEYYPETYGVYAKASGLGFLIRFSGSYPLSHRLSAILQFTTHAAEFSIDDFYYGKKDIWYQNTIPITDTYSIRIVDYLSAQLSGVQLSGGLTYKLF